MCLSPSSDVQNVALRANPVPTHRARHSLFYTWLSNESLVVSAGGYVVSSLCSVLLC